MRDTGIGKRQLRSFGWIVAGGFAVIGFAPAVFRGGHVRVWSVTLSALLAVSGLIAPMALKPVYRVWMTVGELLGWVNTRVILFLVYYGVIVPTGMMLRAMGKDPLRLKFEPGADSYRVPRTKRPPSHMQRQY